MNRMQPTKIAPTLAELNQLAMTEAAQVLRRNGLCLQSVSKWSEAQYFAMPIWHLHDELIRIATHEPMALNRECVSVHIASEPPLGTSIWIDTSITGTDALRQHIERRILVALWFLENRIRKN